MSESEIIAMLDVIEATVDSALESIHEIKTDGEVAR